MMNDTVTRLLAALTGHVPPAGLEWLGRATESAAEVPAEGRRSAFLNDFAAATRRLGKALLGAPLAEGATADEIGRVALLAAAPEGEQEDLAAECFRHGETREKRGVLRALPLLPRPERFAALAADACRAHVQPVFEAICCENPYPAAFFSDLAFRQMVLKALFVGVSLDRVSGLRARTDAELVRMAQDYASERRAAGRPVPADIDRYFGSSPAA